MLLLQAKQELSDSKLDLRVAEREAKANQDTIAFLREKGREQRTQLGEKEVNDEPLHHNNAYVLGMGEMHTLVNHL